MIKKERLEELMEQGADIWKIEDGKVYRLRKDHHSFWIIKEDKIEWYCKIMPASAYYIPFNHLFETKEDAEEYAEFGDITRTERLELPSWEEFNSTKFSYWFMGKNQKEYHIHNVADEIYIGEKFEIVFNKPLTRENYNEARRLCKKLFLGEDVCEK